MTGPDQIAPLIIPDRGEYLKTKAGEGVHIMGVLPALYPRELLWAHGILPAEIWDPPGEIVQANAHLQASICGVVKRGLEFILHESDLITSGYLFPHTCDSLQNLGSQVKDLLDSQKPIYSFYNPKAANTPATTTFYLESLKGLSRELSPDSTELSPEELIPFCELGAEIDQLRAEIMAARAADHLELSNKTFRRLMRAEEYLLPQDHYALLHTAQNHIIPIRKTGLPILLSGILAPQDEILDLLDNEGISIVADDLLSGSRRYPMIPLQPQGDPWEYLSDRYFRLPPCSTQANSLHQRIEHLEQLISNTQAQGVLFNIVKFCEPELFDHKSLVNHFRQCGFPTLKLETELEAHSSGQNLTRVEAFIEMLKERAIS